MCPLLCPLLCPIGHIFCCAPLYIVKQPTLEAQFYMIKWFIFNKKQLTFICSMFNPKPVELNLVLFILAKLSLRQHLVRLILLCIL